MVTTTEKIMSALLVAGLAYWGYQSWIVHPEKQRQKRETTRAADSKRFEQWAYIAKEKEIAPGETIKLAVIPSATGIDFLDTKCLIYTHREFKTSSMICPDARQGDIDTAAE
jgi:hypothetical protein